MTTATVNEIENENTQDIGDSLKDFNEKIIQILPPIKEGYFNDFKESLLDIIGVGRFAKHSPADYVEALKEKRKKIAKGL